MLFNKKTTVFSFSKRWDFKWSKSGLNLGSTLVKWVTWDNVKNTLLWRLSVSNILERGPKSNFMYSFSFFFLFVSLSFFIQSRNCLHMIILLMTAIVANIWILSSSSFLHAHFTAKIDIYFYYLPEQQSKTTKTTIQFNNQATYI